MGLMKVNFRIFYKDKEILAIDHYSIVREHQPYLIFIVQYRTPVVDEKIGQIAKKKDDAWREIMDKEDLPLFEALRDWRSNQCKIEDVPPYVLGNNKQLAEMAHARPKSLTELVKIGGFGKNKTEKYGQMILQELTTQTQSKHAQTHSENSDDGKTCEWIASFCRMDEFLWVVDT